MKLEKQKRIFTAWMLLLCLLPLAVTKMTHHHDHQSGHTCTEMHMHMYMHDHDSTEAEDSPAHDHSEDPDHCEICHFVLSPFLAFETGHLQLFLILISVKESSGLSEGTTVPAHIYSLRAPPAV